MANPFYVQPALATQSAMQGIGQLAKAGGQYFANSRSQDQNIQNTQQFMTLVGQAEASQNPEDRKSLMIQAFTQFPEQAKQLRQQSAYAMEQQQLEQAGKPESTNVGAQEILEDGTVIQSTGKGVKVYGPTGELLTGQTAADAIKSARAYKVSNLRKAAGEKRTAALEAEKELKGEVEAGVISQKEAANASIKAFDKIDAINEKIGLYDEGIALIDEGAGTGPVEKLFPSFKAASVKLKNLENRLGLDVIGNTTFGALSAGELAMAMETAMPVGLDGPELKDWLIEKKQTQEKLADYLESAAIYLGTPGNTKVGWLKKKKLERTQKSESRQQKQAPQAAIDFLMANPQASDQFKAKFGYLPEGM